MCRFSRLGRSKALPQTSQGSSARSPRCGRAFGEARGILVMVVSCRSPVLLAADDDVDDSPETDLCSSSVLDGGEMGSMTRDSSDMDRSSGDSAEMKNRCYNCRLYTNGGWFWAMMICSDFNSPVAAIRLDRAHGEVTHILIDWIHDYMLDVGGPGYYQRRLSVRYMARLGLMTTMTRRFGAVKTSLFRSRALNIF